MSANRLTRKTVLALHPPHFSGFRIRDSETGAFDFQRPFVGLANWTRSLSSVLLSLSHLCLLRVMWLLPRPCTVTVFWSVIDKNAYFEIHKYKTGGLMSLISTARSINPLDANPQPFRYAPINIQFPLNSLWTQY